MGRLELSLSALRQAVALGVALAICSTPAAGVAAANGTGASFELAESRAGPASAFFDAEQPVRLRYRFTASRRLDVLIRVVRRSDGDTVRRWIEPGLAPGKLHRRRWDGRQSGGAVAADGAYEFRVGPLGHRGEPAGRFRFHGHIFPVAGEYAYGDRFGDPRSGGRVHEGQDLTSPCATPLLAARGGRVRNEGYSDALYGYYVTIDGLATKRDYFYAHLEASTLLSDGERVRTGQRIGSVGMTGNARGEFCQLHFELWPNGYRNGAPQDPLELLQTWDAG